MYALFAAHPKIEIDRLPAGCESMDSGIDEIGSRFE
jgi:hypothetical protein